MGGGEVVTPFCCFQQKTRPFVNLTFGILAGMQKLPEVDYSSCLLELFEEIILKCPRRRGEKGMFLKARTEKGEILPAWRTDTSGWVSEEQASTCAPRVLGAHVQPVRHTSLRHSGSQYPT